MAVSINGKKLDLSKIRLSSHAYQRYLERFKIKKDKKDIQHVNHVVRCALGRSQFMGRERDEDGKEGYLFIAKSYGEADMKIIVSDDLHVVKTVMRQKKVILPKPEQEAVTTIYAPLQAKINELYAKEYRKLERLERQLEKRSITAEFELNYEIAALRLRIFKTRSEAVKLACQARINTLEQELERLKQEVSQTKSTRKKITKYIVAI